MPKLADLEAFRHIMRNLLSNAEKFSPAGTPIELRGRVHGDESSSRR